MKIIKLNTKPLQVLAGALAISFSPTLCEAQEPQQPQAVAPVTEQPAATALLDETTIRGEAGLQAPVSFEAKRQKLPEALAALSKQSGVTLTVAPDSPFVSKLLTARANAMPLAKVLVSLSKLYGTSWAKQGDGFELRSNERSLLENAWWKLWYTKFNAYLAADADSIDWNLEVANLGAARLQQKGGVPLAEMPEDIVQKLRDQMEGSSVPEYALALDAARLPKLMGGKVEISDLETAQGPNISIDFYAPDGKYVGNNAIEARPEVAPDAK